MIMEINDRQELIEKLYQMANQIYKKFDREIYDKIWELASDWNRDHDEREEIFVAEHYNDNDEMDGIYIEDDYWIYDDQW